ncbi:MAG: GMC family oxidoreductase [Bacteroidetes bacterium]|nr:MAG: GMC family oxidoreductase [Bacteroidota bacterium]
MKNKHVNAIVVGAGAGGGIVAKELAVAGLSVVLFERGGWATYDDHDDDELISQRTTVLGNAFGPDDKRHRRVVVYGDGSPRIVLPSEGGYSNNAACVGSGTVSYGAMAWRFMEQDFKLKTIYGHVEGSTLEDWPISYSDLEPYYEKAEWEIGVSGESGANPFESPREKSYPMPPFSLNREGNLLSDAAKRLGLHPFPIPMLRNSIRYNGRPACYRMRSCVGFACPVNAKCGTHNTVIPTAIQSGNCELRTNCQVAEIILDERGRATGVKYFDENEKGQIQTADIVVVSAAAIETARLLLNSKSKLFPNGAGNNNDWVGRNLQGHAYTGALGLMKDEVYDDVGPGACMAVCDFNHGNPGIIGGGALCNEFTAMPYLFSKMRPPGSKTWGIEHKEYQRSMFKRVIRLHGPFQEIPNFESRVSIDPEVKDDWGIPTVRLSGSRHEYDRIGCQFMSDRAEEILKEAGAYFTWQSVGGRGLSGGQHQAGTARMGNDPETSVTNKFGQVHEIDNLFVADGSLCVTNGGFNPALTIMALGYWVGDYIKKNWNGTKFK